VPFCPFTISFLLFATVVPEGSSLSGAEITLVWLSFPPVFGDSFLSVLAACVFRFIFAFLPSISPLRSVFAAKEPLLPAFALPIHPSTVLPILPTSSSPPVPASSSRPSNAALASFIHCSCGSPPSSFRTESFALFLFAV
jgi:hypothetical protein